MANRVPLDRQAPRFRDATRFVIEVEGSVTEPWYFDNAKPLIARRRVWVEILPGDTHSDPTAVVNRAAAAALLPGDRVWVVVDLDRWGQQGKLQQAGSEAHRRGYGFAVSNPCFEVWLQLHVTDTPEGATSAAAKSAWKIHKAALGTAFFSRAQIAAATRRSTSAEVDGFVRPPRDNSRSVDGGPGPHTRLRGEPVIGFENVNLER